MSVVVQHRRDTTANVEANTPAAAELWMDTTKKEASIGDGALAGGVRLAKKNIRDVVIASQITSNQNNYSPTDLKHAGTLIISSDASRNISGLVPLTVTDATDGRDITLYNAGSFNIVLQDQNASSTAANRFDLGGADVTLSPKQSVTLRYRTQGSLNRWEIKARTDGQAVSDGAITARKLATSSMGMSMINGALAASVAGNALTVAIKTLAGTDPSVTDPVYVLLRNFSAATGDYVVMTLTAATSVVVSSGSSLGVAANNTAFRIWVAGFNDAGTFRLAVINCLNGTSIYPLSGNGFGSSTAEGGAGAADSAHTFYTGTAVSGRTYAALGFMTWDTGLASVGAWAAAPTRVQLHALGGYLPGQEIQRARTDVSAVATGTTVIPNDDTIPQISEGDQYMTQAISPVSPANLLDVEGRCVLSTSASTNNMIAALFRDATANAIVASQQYSPTALGLLQIAVNASVLAGSTSTTTFRVRGGGSGAGTTTFNGFSAGRIFGGVMNSLLQVREIMT